MPLYAVSMASDLFMGRDIGLGHISLHILLGRILPSAPVSTFRERLAGFLSWPGIFMLAITSE